MGAAARIPPTGVIAVSCPGPVQIRFRAWHVASGVPASDQRENISLTTKQPRGFPQSLDFSVNLRAIELLRAAQARRRSSPKDRT
jgi:hypothetical protein